jgi:hypothetical protein
MQDLAVIEGTGHQWLTLSPLCMRFGHVRALYT